MKVKLYVLMAAWIMLTLAAMTPAIAEPAARNLLEELQLPEFPGSKLLTEINLPAGKLLDSLAKEFGPWLGLSEIKQVSVLVYSIEQDAMPQEVLKFYEPSIAKKEWKTMVRSFAKDQGLAILFNEKLGMLVMSVDPPSRREREMTLIRIQGLMDPSRIADPDKRLPGLIGKMVESAADGGSPQSAATIPIGRPISVPPSEKLHVKATRSDVKARMANGNTAEVRMNSRTDDAGELVRIDERLVLALPPKADVEEIILPAAVPILLELTDGSLELLGGPDAPAKLNIVSTGAPVDVLSFPLVSGSHNIKVMGGAVNVSLSQVSGGALEIEATGKDIMLEIPVGSSARITATATSGKIRNLSGVEPSQASDDTASLQFGAGKAEISLRAVNGNVCIKTTD